MKLCSSAYEFAPRTFWLFSCGLLDPMTIGSCFSTGLTFLWIHSMTDRRTLPVTISSVNESVSSTLCIDIVSAEDGASLTRCRILYIPCRGLYTSIMSHLYPRYTRDGKSITSGDRSLPAETAGSRAPEMLGSAASEFRKIKAVSYQSDLPEMCRVLRIQSAEEADASASESTLHSLGSRQFISPLPGLIYRRS